MITRFSSLFVRTLRDDPSDAEIASHKLLVRAGYVRRMSPGIFAWLPLGLRVKAKIEQIVREEMHAAGSQEVHFPALLPADTYQATGRYDEYGPNMFRLQDRRETPMVLAPTHEEAFTVLVKQLYNSHKDLPLSIFQIQDKYRDEARPRAGLLRGREFTMKDAYSFDVDAEGLNASYQAQRDAYERIFQRLGLDYVIVAADAGAMGGSKSEEFLHPTPIGEDTFVVNDAGYAANVEAFTQLAPEPIDATSAPAAEVFDTPGATTIAKIVDYERRAGREIAASDTLKNLIVAVTTPAGERRLVAIGVPGDREVDEKRLEVAFAPDEVETATAADFTAHPELVRGFIGPWSPQGQFLGSKGSTGIEYLVDPQVVAGSSWITGMNTADKHVRGLVAGRDFIPDGTVEVTVVREGDEAPDGSGPVRTARGVEIGHVFQLGTKYAEALDLRVLDEHGKLVTVTMGSYGIGITRNLALIAEQNHDDRGLVWPRAVAPFDVQVVRAGKDEAIERAADEIAAGLDVAGYDVLLDDRERVSPGVKFKDAELIGVPIIVIAGRGVENGLVELWDRRDGNRTEVAIAELETRIASLPA